MTKMHHRVATILETVGNLGLVFGLLAGVALFVSAFSEDGSDSSIFVGVVIGVGAVLNWALLRAVVLVIDYLHLIAARLDATDGDEDEYDDEDVLTSAR